MAMKCTEAKCVGEINTANPIRLRTSCAFYSFAFQCNECGRLHWKDGTPVFNRANLKAFLENGAIVHRD